MQTPWHLLHSTLWHTTGHRTVSACTAALRLAENDWNILTRPQPPCDRWYWKCKPRSGSACRSRTLQNTERRNTQACAVGRWRTSNGVDANVTCPHGPVYHSRRFWQGPESHGVISAGRSPSQLSSGRSVTWFVRHIAARVRLPWPHSAEHWWLSKAYTCTCTHTHTKKNLKLNNSK